MKNFESTRIETKGLHRKHNAMMPSILAALRIRRLRHNQDRSVLQARASTLEIMSDHALRDIGLSRTDLPAIAANFRFLENCQESGRRSGRASSKTP
jgi:uncharacterized protein YjiS (DUF1127 family)